MKRILIILLSIVTSFNFVACNRNQNNKENNNEGNKVEFTQTIVAANGTSDYKIVIPELSNEQTKFASSELKQFLYELTNANISVINDTGLTYDENCKYFSIGETSLASSANVTVDKNVVTGEGFRVVTKGNSVFLLGGGDNGLMYSVYDFLETTYGVEIYAEDEIYFPKAEKFLLPKLDYTEKPSIQIRAINSYEFNNSQTFRRRMRTHNRQEGWIYNSHSFFAILPLAEYWEQHKDWYSADKTQLCLSNEEMTAEFIERLYLLYNDPQYKDAENCMIGLQDSNTWCTCSNCTPEIAKYKESGMMVRFVNKVYKGLREKLDANGQQERKVRLFLYAYYKTLTAPVDSKGNPLDESVRPNGNIGVMIAPLSAKYDVALNHEQNIDVKNQITAWRTLFEENIYMYIYGANYGLYPLMVNDFGSIKENYKYFEDIGTIGVHHLDSYNALASDLSQLKNYMQSKLMWDTSLDSEELIKDFCKHYYKDASEHVLTYINLWRMQYAENQVVNNKYSIVNTNASKTWINSKYWSLEFLNACDALMDKAFKSIEHYKGTDGVMYNKLLSRIKLQSLSHRFLMLELYVNVLPIGQLNSMIDSFENDSLDVGMISSGEHVNTSPRIATYVEKWRLSVLSRVE